MSFDVTLLFKNVPLDYTNGIIVNRIYNTLIFSYCVPKMCVLVEIIKFMKNRWCSMISLLDLVVASIFIVVLEKTVLSSFNEYIAPWKRYLEDAIFYIEEELI